MATRGPTLTFFFIAMVIFVGVVLLIYTPEYGIYDNIIQDNGMIPDDAYTQSFINNISSTKGSITNTSDSYSDLSWGSVLQTAGDIISGTFNTLVIGFSAIRTLSSLPKFFSSLFNASTDILPIPDPIIWIITTGFIIFLASKLIKALRGTIDDA